MDAHTFAAADFRFDAPGRLWLLAVLAVAGVVGLLVRWRHRRGSEQYAEAALLPSVAPHRPGWRRPVAAGGLVLAVLALTTAFARPQVLADHATERAVVLVALDTSSSMMATDVAPDRFTAATAAAKAFVRDLPADVDVGLVSYDAAVTLVAAPTAEHEQVARAVDGLTMSGGTAAGDALLTSLDAVASALPQADLSRAGRIVLLSDGDSTIGTPLPDATTAVQTAGVPVSTIAYGTPGGIVVANGITYQVPVNSEALAQVAAETGGTAYTAASAEQLRATYDDITSQLVQLTRRTDLADLFAGGALALLAAGSALSLAWFSRLV